MKKFVKSKPGLLDSKGLQGRKSRRFICCHFNQVIGRFSVECVGVVLTFPSEFLVGFKGENSGESKQCSPARGL